MSLRSNLAVLGLTCIVVGPVHAQINDIGRIVNQSFNDVARMANSANRAISVVDASSQSVAAVSRPGQLDASIIVGVAEFGTALSVALPSHVTVGDVIAERCGKPSFATQVHPVYWERVQRLNATASITSPSANVASIRLPACVPFALKEGEVGIEGGIEKLVKQLRVPFDFQLFEQLANERDKSTAIAKYQDLKKNYLSSERNPCPPSNHSLEQRFACINTIEFVYENRDRITTAARIQSPVRVLSSIVGEVARIPIATDAAAAAAEWAKRPDEKKGTYREANGLPNVIPQASIDNDSTQLQSIQGVDSLNIHIRNPLAVAPARPGAPQPARVPAKTITTSEGEAVQVTSVAIEPDVKFVGAVRNVGIYGLNCSSAAEKREGSWPFSAAKFVRSWAMHMRKAPNTKPTSLLIIDSGMDFLHDLAAPDVPERYVFPAHNFWTNTTDQAANPNLDKDNDGIFANLNFSGVNLTSQKRAAITSIVDLNRDHGLAVTALTLGGRGLEYYRSITPFPIKISVASIVELGTKNYVLNSQHITQGFQYAARHSFNVINLSLSTLKTPAAIGLVALQGTVIVAAAGNDAKTIEDKYPIWPALDGGINNAPNPSSSVIVTVGAHDAANQLAGFSNKGWKHVDVLAPGCMVPSYELKRTAGEYDVPPRITPAHVSGTSFAAPTVSFLAAMIMSDPSASGPTAVKERIILGTDFNQGLEDDVFASGVINVEKILGHRYDLLEVLSDTGKRELLFGEVLNKDKIPSFKCNGATVVGETIRKLAYDKENKKLLVITKDQANKPSSFERRICDYPSLPIVPLEFRNVETGQVTAYPIDRLIDYIPE